MIQTDVVCSILIMESLNLEICPVCGNDLLVAPTMRNKFCGKCSFVAVYREAPDSRLKRYKEVKAYEGLTRW